MKVEKGNTLIGNASVGNTGKGIIEKGNKKNHYIVFLLIMLPLLLFLFGCSSQNVSSNVSNANINNEIGNEQLNINETNINETALENISNTEASNSDFGTAAINEPLSNFNNFFIDRVDKIDGFFYYNCNELNEEQLSKYNACLESNDMFFCSKECNKEYIRPEQGNIFYAISYGFVITKQEAEEKGITCEEKDGKCFVKTLSAMPFNAMQTFLNIIAGTKITYKYYLEDADGNLYVPDYRVKFGYVFNENETLKPFVFSVPSGKQVKYFVIKEYRRDFGIAKREILIAKIRLS